MPRDRLAERLPRGRVRHGRVDARLREATRPRGDGVAAGVESRHSDLEAFADRTQALAIGDAHVVEDQLARVRRAQSELPVDGLTAVAMGVALEQEGRDPRVSFRRIRLREDEREVRHGAVRYPGLAAAEDPRAAVAPRGRADLRRVTACLGLGETEAPEELSLTQARQVAALLLLGAETQDRERHERDLHRERRPNRGIRAAELLRAERVRRVVRAE